MKKLFEVEVRYYVMAEDLEEARSVSLRISDGEMDITAFAVTSVNDAWRTAIPFNSDDDRTCDEILKGEKE